MAKKQRGYYSPNAIIGRAKEQAYEKTKRETLPTEEKTSFPPPQLPSIASRATTPTVKPTENVPPAKPFLALSVSENGTPIWGSGFKGWVRKMWSDLSDPSKYFQDQNDLSQSELDDIKSKYEQEVSGFSKAFEEKTKWSQWGEKFFGLSATEIAALPAGQAAELEIAKETGDNTLGTYAARQIRLGVDTAQNAVWGGLQILGLDDQLMRKIHTTRLGVDALADRFNADTEETFFQKITINNPVGFGRDLYTVGNALVTGKLSWSDAEETITKYQAASEMAYSMVFSEMTRAEFEKGVAEGKDPFTLSQDLGNLGIELAGSILGSPSTYLGASILKPVNILSKEGRIAGQVMSFAGREVKLFGVVQKVPWQTVGRIPTFGQIIGASLGRARMANEAARFTSSLDFGGLEEVLKKANTAEGEADAIRILKTAAESAATKLEDMHKHKKWWNLASLDSRGKINVTSKDSALFIQNIIASEGSVDGALQVMRDMVIARRGGQEAVQAAARLMSRNHSSMIFSEVGNMVGEIVSRLDDGGVVGFIKKNANDPIALHEGLMKNLEATLADFVPSVDEMLDAERMVGEAKKLGRLSDIPEKTLRLAEMASDVPDVVKAVNRATRIPEKITKATTNAMVQMFMNLIPRSVSRNITGQTIPMAMHLGLKNALEISASAVLGFNRKATTDLLEAGQADILKRLGYIPAEAMAGIGDNIKKITTGTFNVGFLPAMQRSEQITSNRIVLQVATDEIQKALPVVVKDLPEWDALVASLPKEQKGLMFAALNRAYGDFDEAVNIFRKWVGEGEIEAWRITEPSQNMKKQLESLGLMDDFYEIQMTARTSDDFKVFVDDALKIYEDKVTKAAQELPWLADKLPSKLQGFGMDLAKYAPEQQSKIIRGLIQSWQNTLEQLDNVTQKVMLSARSMANEATRTTGSQELFNKVEQIAARLGNTAGATSKNHDEINFLRDEVWSLIRSSDNMSPIDFVKAFKTPIKIGGKEVFSLSKLYPNVDFSTLTNKQFKKLVWTAFFETSSNSYRGVNVSVYEKSMDTFEELAKLFGTTIEDMAGSSKAGDNPFFVLSQFRQTTDQIEEAHTWQRFFRQLDFDDSKDTNALLKDVVGKFESVFPDWRGNKKHIVNAVNKGSKTPIPYEEVTLKQALVAVGRSYIVPPETGQLPSEAEALYRGLKNFKEDVTNWSDTVILDWGKKVKSLPPNIEDKLKATKSALKPRIDRVKLEAGVTAVSMRNFLLHDYNRTYMDHALTYLLGSSFHYWTTRTFVKTMETLLDNPKFANWYLRYKQYNAKRNSEMPDYYQQNIQINSIMGIELANPLFMNLEASINPIYGLTGTDFNDPRKRVDWVSRAIDDMNKMGTTFSPLISWAVAMHLYDIGEQDAGQRYAGRLLPFSQVVKSASSKLLGEPIEIDPFVNFLDGGTDPYEKNRVAAAMAMMVRDGEYTSEQMIEASRMKSGEMWEEAIRRSADARFAGDISSFFLGTGMRPRTQNDLVIEKFWQDYGAMISSRSAMSADQYRQAWDNMRDNPEYGMFMDALLLSRKSGTELDSAYAYNVLGRIPPGQMNDVSRAVDIDPEMLQLFYDNKGDIEKMNLSEGDRLKFMGGIAHIGAMYAIPDNSTRDEWNLARSQYSQMNEDMKATFGDDIQEGIDAFYNDPNPDTYLELNPLVKQALDFQTQYIVSDPILNKYYGGIDKIDRYYKNAEYNILLTEFGEEVVDLVNEYYDPTTSIERGKEIKPLIKEYIARKKELDQERFNAVVEFGKLLPEPPRPEARFDAEAQGVSQEELLNLTQPPKTLEEWTSIVGQPTLEILQDYLYSDEPIPYAVQQKLDWIAEDEGYQSGDELTQVILLSMP